MVRCRGQTASRFLSFESVTWTREREATRLRHVGRGAKLKFRIWLSYCWITLSNKYKPSVFSQSNAHNCTYVFSLESCFQLSVIKPQPKFHSDQSQRKRTIQRTNQTRKRSWREARENVCERVTIGLGFASDRVKKWREFFKANHVHLSQVCIVRRVSFK